VASPDKHLVKLQEILQPGEAVLGHVAGTITTTPTSTSGTVRGSLVITDRRFLFSGGSWGATDSRSLPLSNVTSIDLHKNLMLAYVQVAHAGGFDRYMVKYNDAAAFVKVAHEALANAHQQPAAAAPPSSTADDLAKLAELHASGVLSDDEFTAAKARVLG
jgi:hypothetical protein